MFKADLHIHSHFSDGRCSIDELIQLALEHNIPALSITDHDVTDAYPEIITKGQAHGLDVIPGIELSTHYEETTVHVLGYSFELNHPALKAPIEALKLAREQRIDAILERLHKRKVMISHEELRSTFKGMLGRPHIAHLMVKKGYVSTPEQAFDNFLGDKHMSSLKLKTLTTVEAIEIIHQAKGKAVLAHPHLIKQKNKLKKILQLPFDGIEAYYAKLPQKVDYFIDYATEHNMFWTGGSDFHYPKPYQPLGCSFTPKETFDILHALAQQNDSPTCSEPQLA